MRERFLRFEQTPRSARERFAKRFEPAMELQPSREVIRMSSLSFPILLVINQPSDWDLYMPHLIGLARERNADIHVLETGTAFTKNVLNIAALREADLRPANPASHEVAGSERPPRTTAFLEELLAYLRDAGIRATGEWQPDHDRTQLGPYADAIGVRTIAVIDHGFPVNVLLCAYIELLEMEGFEVVRLHPVSATKVMSTRGRNVGTVVLGR
jgi:hypothetical protein